MQILNKRRIKKLAKNRNIELRKASKEFLFTAATTISNGKNIKVEPINSTFKNEIMSYCNEYLLEKYLLIDLLMLKQLMLFLLMMKMKKICLKMFGKNIMKKHQKIKLLEQNG